MTTLQAQPIEINGDLFPSLTAAARARGCSTVNIHKLGRRYGKLHRGVLRVTLPPPRKKPEPIAIISGQRIPLTPRMVAYIARTAAKESAS